MMTIQPGGVVCHVARAAEFVYPMIATGQWLISWPGTRGRDYCIYGAGRRWRSGQYRRQPVLRLG